MLKFLSIFFTIDVSISQTKSFSLAYGLRNSFQVVVIWSTFISWDHDNSNEGSIFKLVYRCINYHVFSGSLARSRLPCSLPSSSIHPVWEPWKYRCKLRAIALALQIRHVSVFRKLMFWNTRMVGPCLCTRHDSYETSNAVNSYQQNEIPFFNSSPKENAAAEAMQTLKAAVRNILRSLDVYKLNLHLVERHRHSRLVMKAFIYVAHSWYLEV